MVKYDASAFQPYAVLLRVFSAYLHEIFFASLAPFKLREQGLAGAASLPSYKCSSQNNPAIRRRVSPGMKVVDGDEEKRWTWDCLHFCEHSVRKGSFEKGRISFDNAAGCQILRPSSTEEFRATDSMVLQVMLSIDIFSNLVVSKCRA